MHGCNRLCAMLHRGKRCTGCRQERQPHLLKRLWVWLAEVTHEVGTKDAIKLILQASTATSGEVGPMNIFESILQH